MSEQKLPEDMERWPREAHKLLQVSQYPAERDLKRAYARLIRQYKPDHYPQQFARIRAAYEELIQQLEWRNEPEENVISLNRHAEPAPLDNEQQTDGDSRDVLATPTDAAADVDDRSPLDDDHIDVADQWARSKSQPQPGTVESAWTLACDGDLEVAYRQLVALHDRDRGQDDICLRLYWLLRVRADLDQRDCSDWLVETLSRHGLEGSSWDAYRNELRRRPELIDSPGHIRLRNTDMTTSRLMTFLRLRWRAAAELGRWYLIESDLRDFRDAMLLDATSSWAHLLFLAADLTVWSTEKIPQAILKACMGELEELTELHLEMSNAYARHDQVRELARGLGTRSHSAPPLILQVIREGWLDTHYEQRPHLQQMLDEWVQDPATTLATLDQLRLLNTPVFQQLAALVRRLDPRENEYRANEAQRLDEEGMRIVDFLDSCPTSAKFPDLRLRLLHFCIQRQVRLHDVMFVFNNWTLPDSVKQRWQELSDDASLRVLLHGIAAYWA